MTDAQPPAAPTALADLTTMRVGGVPARLVAGG